MDFRSTFRDTFAGQFVRLCGGKHLLPYPEERADFQVPEKFRRGAAGEKGQQQTRSAEPASETASEDTAVGDAQGEKDDHISVGWYGDDDPANPQNWSQGKKSLSVASLCFLTFSVYMASSIVTPAIPIYAQQQRIGVVTSTLQLSLFVFGYAIGPMFLAPLSEIPSIGRNAPYIVTLFIFMCLQIPTALCSSPAAIFILRFLAGFFGSPALATGGASIADLYSARKRAYFIGIWGLSAVAGPALGPLVGGFAVQALGISWAIWPVLFASGAALVWLIFLLPETSSANILARRASRLRALTGNDKLKSEGEIQQANMTGKQIAQMTLIRPFTLNLEPIVLALNLYIALIYAVLYSFLEAFPIVFEMTYGFNAGLTGCAFLGLAIGAIIGYALFAVFCHFRLEKLFDQKGGEIDPEDRLEAGFPAPVLLAIGILMFGWTSTASIHWIVPIIGGGIFSVGTFLSFQAVLAYLSDAYEPVAASALASNDLVRSMAGGAFPLFSRALFQNLGSNEPRAFPVAWGCTILGGAAALFTPLCFIIHRYGPALRRRSPNAAQPVDRSAPKGESKA